MTAIFEDVLRDLILSANLTDRRVFLIRAPQKPAEQMKTPYMVFTPTGPEPLHHQGGPSGLQCRHYQISIFDGSQSRTLAIADSIRAHLDGYKGDYEGVHFGSIFFRLQSVFFESDTRLYQVVTEFRFWFRLLESFAAVHTKGA